MPEYQLQIKQVVDYPRCRIYRQFVHRLMADRSIRASGGSGLFYFRVSVPAQNHNVQSILLSASASLPSKSAPSSASASKQPNTFPDQSPDGCVSTAQGQCRTAPSVPCREGSCHRPCLSDCHSNYSSRDYRKSSVFPAGNTRPNSKSVFLHCGHKSNGETHASKAFQRADCLSSKSSLPRIHGEQSHPCTAESDKHSPFLSEYTRRAPGL